MTHLHATFRGELASVAQDEKRLTRESAARWTRLEIGRAMTTIAASVVVMAGLMAFRLWFLMPASFHFPG